MAKLSFSQQTDDDFYRARNKALFNSIQHFLTPEEASLISLSDLKKVLKPNNETYKGMQTVPVKLIVGSEGRYKDFDNQFFPKNTHLKSRWESIDRAHLQNIILPPVTLYELGGLYFARDGNHRISVAKARGIEFIDAEVISLQSEIKLKPGKSMKTLLAQIIAYKKEFFILKLILVILLTTGVWILPQPDNMMLFTIIFLPINITRTLTRKQKSLFKMQFFPGMKMSICRLFR